jgi:hypothetical protein
MSYKDIRVALESTLNSISGLPDINWENINFTPQTGQSWIRARVLPQTRQPAQRGPSPQMRYTGIYELLVYTPANQSPQEAENICEVLINNFEATSDIVTDDVRVSIRSAEREVGITDSPWYYVPVVINWYAYTT